jgi:nucleoside-diphosphate-sugar epimerase
MKIVLAGASGVIGRALLPLLEAAGHDTVGLARGEGAAETIRSLGGRPALVDVYDRDALIQALRLERPDVVIHELTSLGASDYEANNRIRTEGSRNLVDAALAAGVRRMVAQSYCLYGPGEGLADETEPFDVGSAVFGSSAKALLALEATVGEVSEAVLLRYGTMYGPGTSYAATGATAEQARKRQLFATGDVTSFVHVRDVARAALLALDWPTGPVNIVDDDPAPATEWLPVYAAAVGAPPPPTDPTKAIGLRGASNERARKELGWVPLVPSWRDGLRHELGSARPVGMAVPRGRSAGRR